MSTMSDLDAIKCARCDESGWTVRVTGGDLDGAHTSTLACDLCAPSRLAIIRRQWPDAAVHPLPEIGAAS